MQLTDEVTAARVGSTTRAAVAAWAVLMAATLVSWYFGDGHGPTHVAAVCVVAVGFVKVLVVGWHFMELREAPPALKGIFALWCTVVPVAMVTVYLIG